MIALLFCLVLSFSARAQPELVGVKEEIPVKQEVKVENENSDSKVKVDHRLLSFNDTNRIDNLFKNMVVIQKKAIERKNKWIFDTHLSFDFSDNPKTMYATAFGLGYAFSENFEFSISFAPFIIASERSTAKAVRGLTLSNNQAAELYSPDPKWESGINLTWIFAYGKDAFGPYSIIRSDTFLRLFASKVKYEGEFSGERIALFVGKTFFISKLVNFRFAAGFARQSYYINQQAKSTNIGIIEPGFVWFL